MLELRNLGKSFSTATSAMGATVTAAVQDVHLTIPDGEFFSLLGPSGCGKTTLLRMLSGLEEPTSGEILLDGKRIDPLASNKRPFNLVFQRYALFPHLNVRENVAFGLKMKNVPPREISAQVAEMLSLVKLEGFEERAIGTLSGGQQQRVALARALVNRPRVLLLDEPLSALDLKLRQQMQIELLAIQRRLKLTFIFVTHDQEEALTLSDRIAVMNQGVIEQVGTAREIYEYPRTEFVARFIGSINALEGTVLGAASNGAGEGGLAIRGTGPAASARPLVVRPSRDGHPLPALPEGKTVKLLVRPEKMRVLKSEPGGQDNRIEGTLKEILYQGPVTQVFIQPLHGDTPLVSTQPNTAHTARRSFAIGDKVFVAWAPEDGVLIG